MAKFSNWEKRGYAIRLPKLKKKEKKTVKVFKRLVIVGVLGIILVLLYVFYLYKSLPDISTIGERIITQSTKIYDRTGETVLYEIHGEEKRTIIPLSEIPQYIQKAVISIEDAEFYNHPAFDIGAMFRGVIFNPIFRKTNIQGGSTITQQLVKNALLSNERTVTRKIKELILAIKLEKRYSKDQILELYLNQIPFGSNAYGVQSVSQMFFTKDAKDLTLAQSALIAAVIQSPTYYSPYGNHKTELLERKDLVLERMNQQGYIDSSELKQAKAETLEFSPKFDEIKAPHFVMYVKEYLESKYGADYVETAGLKVITTLDWTAQQLAEKVVLEGALRNEELYSGENAALLAQDPKTGQILAMVGSRDYFDQNIDGNFNVTTSHRQPGSSFKPFAYLTAFEQGYTPETILFDVKTEFNYYCPATADGDTDKFGLDCYHPHNFDGVYRGPINLKHSLAQSINVTAVKTLYLAGLKNTIETAQKLGITTLNETSQYGLSLVLGGGDVRPIDMAEAYSVLAQDGQKHPQTAILKIEDSKGNVLEEFKDESEQVVEPQYVRMINDILSDNEARIGLFSRNNLLEISGHEVAAKTGTTQDYRDAWTVGYTPSIVVVIWAGNNDFSPMQKNSGSILAAVPIWNAFMAEYLKDKPAETFPDPEKITTSKPILNGEYISYFKIDNTLYPQIHNILYWVDKDNPQGDIPNNPESDSQFANWEYAVLDWINKNLTNPGQYNIEIPDSYKDNIVGANQNPQISIISPTNGSYFYGTIKLNLTLKSLIGIKSLKIYFNDTLIVNNYDILGESFYTEFTPSNAEAQNKLRIEATDKLGNSSTESIIVFR